MTADFTAAVSKGKSLSTKYRAEGSTSRRASRSRHQPPVVSRPTNSCSNSICSRRHSSSLWYRAKGSIGLSRFSSASASRSSSSNLRTLSARRYDRSQPKSRVRSFLSSSIERRFCSFTRCFSSSCFQVRTCLRIAALQRGLHAFSSPGRGSRPGSYGAPHQLQSASCSALDALGRFWASDVARWGSDAARWSGLARFLLKDFARWAIDSIRSFRDSTRNLAEMHEQKAVIRRLIDGHLYEREIGPCSALSIREAADYLGCDRERVRQLVQGGRLPRKIRRGVFRIQKRDLDRFLESTSARRMAGPERRDNPLERRRRRRFK